MPLGPLPAPLGQPIEGCEGATATLGFVFVEPPTVLDRDEHGQGASIPLDQEALTRRRSVEDLAEPAPEVERANSGDSHGGL